MVSGEVRADGRRGRVFVSKREELGSELETLAVTTFMDDEDSARLPLLRDLLAAPIVAASAHPGVDPADVFHVYLHSPHTGQARLFACVIVSRERLELMLRESPAVIEGFTLQVVESRRLTRDVIGVALEVWAERNQLPVPIFLVDVWQSELEVEAEVSALDATMDPERDEAILIEASTDILQVGSREMPRRSAA